MRFSIVAALSAFVFLQSSFAAPTTTIQRAISDLTADQLVQALQADVHLATDLQSTIESLNDESSEEDATAVNQAILNHFSSIKVDLSGYATELLSWTQLSDTDGNAVAEEVITFANALVDVLHAMIDKSTLLLQVELEGPLRIGPLLIDTKLAFDTFMNSIRFGYVNVGDWGHITDFLYVEVDVQIAFTQTIVQLN